MGTHFKRTTWGVVLGLMVTGLVHAGDRHFLYSYESGVLNEGDRELETYSTFRFGRNHFYSAFDQQVELEVGLGDGVQTSLYLNFTQEMEDLGGGTPTVSPMFDGIASEWKFKLADNVADPFGLGLYAEPEFKPDELELETKVILDKNLGDWIWTLNLTAEPEYHWVDNTSALTLIPSLGVGYFFSGKFMAGLEAQDVNFYSGQPLNQTASIFSMGPVLFYKSEKWWAALTLLPQVTNLNTGSLDFTSTDRSSQRWQVRLATAWDL